MNRRLGTAGKIYTLLLVAFAASGCGAFGGRGDSRSAAGGATAPTPTPAVTFLEADTDHDARISREEFVKRGYDPERFDSADLNGNGVLTLDEWQAMTDTTTAVANRSRAASGKTAAGAGDAAATRPAPSGPPSPLSR